MGAISALTAVGAVVLLAPSSRPADDVVQSGASGTSGGAMRSRDATAGSAVAGDGGRDLGHLGAPRPSAAPDAHGAGRADISFFVRPVAAAAGWDEWQAGEPGESLAGVDASAGLDLVQFFSYGCAACAQVDPHFRDAVTRWRARWDGLRIHRVPVSFRRGDWMELAALHLALERMGVAGTVGRLVYSAVQRDGLDATNPVEIERWAGAAGVAVEALVEHHRSPQVDMRLVAAQAMEDEFRVDVVPAVAVGYRGQFNVVEPGGGAAWRNAARAADGGAAHITRMMGVVEAMIEQAAERRRMMVV